MVHSELVNRSKSSSEKSTGLSRELCRLGERQASAGKKARSGSAEDTEEEAGAADDEEDVMEESCCSVKRGSDAGAAAAPASPSCIRLGSGGECRAAGPSEEPAAPRSSGVGCVLSPLSAV